MKIMYFYDINLLFIIFTLEIKLITGFFCPSMCTCSFSAKYVTCKGKNLKSIPKGIPDYVEELDLTRNIFNNLSSKSFVSLINLKILRLDHCEIKYIDKSAFDGLKIMKDLFLTNNDISRLHKDMFKNLKSLLHLYLGNNEFEIIPALTSFSMTRLYLDGNHISAAFVHESFKVNTALRTLVLTKNKISTITATDFDSLRNTGLQSLMLKMNNISILEPTAFFPVKDSLQNLELEGNQFLTSTQLEVSLRAFSGGSKILFVDLRHTGLRIISDIFFSPLVDSHLHRLDIGDNEQLTVIKEDAFRGLDRVQILVADRCRISLSNIRFSALTGLRQVNLSGNNFRNCPHRLPGSVEIVDLSHNNIRHIFRDDFKSLSSLTFLNLFNNSIASIELNSFSDLSKLSFLDLSYNRLEIIPPRLFKSLFALTILDIRQQSPCLKHISVDSFPLSNLRSLNLDSNCLDKDTTKSPIFSDCARLSNLSIAQNTIDYLGGDIFFGCHNLSYLSLTRNKIRGWSSDTFTRIKDTLITVDLSFNRISFLAMIPNTENYLPPIFPRLVSVSLDNNQWNCSCSGVQWLRDHRRLVNNADRILCEEPDSRINRNVFEIVIRDNCPSNNLIVNLKTRRNVTEMISTNVATTPIVITVICVVLFVIVIIVSRNKFARIKTSINQYLYPNRYHHMSETMLVDPINYQNVIMDEEVPELLSNSLVIREDMNDFYVGDLVTSPPWLQTVKDWSYVPSEDAVFLTTQVGINLGKLTVKYIDNLQLFENKVTAYHCWKLVIDYPPMDRDIVRAIVTERSSEMFDDENMKGTYLFHRGGLEEDPDVVEWFPEMNVIKYSASDILDHFYDIYDGP